MVTDTRAKSAIDSFDSDMRFAGKVKDSKDERENSGSKFVSRDKERGYDRCLNLKAMNVQ